MLHDVVPPVCMDFDEGTVGHGGAGFVWPHCSALGEQPVHLLEQTPGSNSSDTDNESVRDPDHDNADSTDHEVKAVMLTSFCDTTP